VRKLDQYGEIVGYLSVSRVLWDTRIAQWVEHYGIVGYRSVSRALWDTRIAQWVEHYEIVE